MNTYLRHGPNLPVRDEGWLVHILVPLPDVLCVAALHHTHRANEDGKLHVVVRRRPCVVCNDGTHTDGCHEKLVCTYTTGERAEADLS